MTQAIIGGRYTLQGELGAGGMGTVYLGLDIQTNQTVAIKELKSEITQPDTIERFRREGEALRDLNHPNIVKMLDMFEHEGQHYLVMEYVSGGDLSDLIKQSKTLEIENIVNMSIDLADALTRAHKLNIIHRDLKPANIMIGDDGVLRLTDFGVAHVGSKERVTETDAIVGTIDYLPPEAFDGGTFDARGDIWAFGVILFEMLTGQRPFAGGTLFEVIQNITTSPIPDLEALCPDSPIALVDLVYRMLERDPQARIPSVRIIGAELEAIIEGRESTSQPKRFDTDIPDFIDLPKHNLPVQTTPFVGREHELDELDKLLKDPTIRLITILSQGGMGKTRLSLELAQRAVDANLYADGVYFVELAPLSSAENISNAIGDACGFQFLGDGTPKEQLLSILKDRQTLLVLDNFEHLPDGFSLVTGILQSASLVHILATSRQQLSQMGETLFYLSGMEFPDFETPEDALDYAAIKLFMNSAKRANPSFDLEVDNLDYVARICKLVQGMPLGIVLAASWLTLLDVSEIADEIQGGLDFLETDETSLPERQRSIRAVMDYSWQQMTKTEQNVFMKLSVFRGGFTREAAQAVAGANLRILMALTKKSFIRRNADSGRYEIHELLRQYAEGRLRQGGEFEKANLAHMTYFSEFMAERAIDIKGRRQIEGLDEVEADLDNVLKVWESAIARVKYNELDQMMEALALYFDMRAIYKVGEELFEKAVQQLSNVTNNEDHLILNRLKVRYIQTWILQETIPVPKPMYKMLSICMEVAEQFADNLTLAICYWLKGEFTRIEAKSESAKVACNTSLELLSSQSENYYVGRNLRVLEYVSILIDLQTMSDEYVSDLEQHVRSINDFNGIAHALVYKGAGDNLDKFIMCADEARHFFQLTKDVKSIGVIIGGVARRSFLTGEIDESEIKFLEALEISKRTNFFNNNHTFYSYLILIYCIQGKLEMCKAIIEQTRYIRTGYWGGKSTLAIGEAIYYITQNNITSAIGQMQTATQHIIYKTA